MTPSPLASSIVVRACTGADMDAVAAIYAHHVLHGNASFETAPPSPEEMRRRRADIATRDFPFLVAESEGAVLGYAYASAYRSRPAYRDTVENSVYLHPELTGRGIGGMLLQALIAACKARGLRQMVAVVGDSANAASVRLHEKLGFRLVGVLRSVGYKHGRWLDTVLLQRTLGDGDAAPPLAR